MSGAEDRAAAFFRRGWTVFDPDPETARWAAAARPVADGILADPDSPARDWRCGGTWFAGVNIFPNDAGGAVPARGVPPVGGPAVRFVAEALGLSGFAWDRAQLSVCFPGYPRQGAEESEANHRYRVNRAAAHVDGLLRDAERRRYPGEVHGFILGLPLSEADAGASPMVVWEGSHEIMRRAFRERLAGVPPERWPDEDITETYHAARREAFETCPRVPVHVAPGGSYIVHRLALHGVAPWDSAGETPRIVAYFRPDPFPGAAPGWWLDRP